VRRARWLVCTWVDGGLLQNFPITVIDRNDDKPLRWPTFGIKLSAQVNVPDRAIRGDISELLAIAHRIRVWTLFGKDLEIVGK
jgi:predicted acylesterase/phospholipase RssA